MVRLEIVHLRTFGPDPAALASEIEGSFEAEGNGRSIVTVYRRCGIETDVAVHIHTRSESHQRGPSALGQRLADALREHGLVEHTVWEELR